MNAYAARAQFALSLVVIAVVGCTNGDAPLNHAPLPATRPAEQALAEVLWQELPGGIDWGAVPPSPSAADARDTRFSKLGEPLIVRVFIRNRFTTPTTAPVFYRDRAAGGPALLHGVSMHLEKAPFDPRTHHIWYPRDEDYTALSPLRNNTFAPGQAALTLKPLECREIFSLDLRDWFAVAQEAHYRFYFDFEPARIGLADQPQVEPRRCSYRFDIGQRPPLLSPAELNRSIPALGDKDAEARLRKLIAETVPPSTRPATGPTTRLLHGAQFPQISARRFMGGNMSGHEPEVTQISYANGALFDAPERYDPASLRAELERRMERERDVPLKLYTAALAARAESRAAALYLLESMQTTDYSETRNVHSAIRIALGDRKNVPEWLIELAKAALADQRYVTGMDKAGVSSESHLTVSYMADEDGYLTWGLGAIGARSAVPLLIEMVRRPEGSRHALAVLGDFSDERAIPAVMEVLKREARQPHLWGGMLLPEQFAVSARAAAKLKARDAKPVLLAHLCHEDIVEALELLGDPSVVPALEQIVSAGKPQQVEGSTPDSDRACVWAARIALVTLKDADPVPRYCELLADRSMGEYARRDVVARLHSHPDPRAIPHLVKAIKSDPSGAVVNSAISVLSAFRYKAAVDGLIECFDADFSDKADWKRAYTPAMFRENVSAALREITGREMHTKAEWQQWWASERDRSALK